MNIRIDAAEALGSIGDRRMVRIFTNILLVPPSKGNGDLALRMYAAQSLGEKKEKTATDALIKNIDPTTENELNYVCLEALGKIEDPDGFRKLLPVFKIAAPVWLEKREKKDNFYAAMWALFLYKAPELSEICSDAFASQKDSYSEAAFICAYYLLRNTAAPDPSLAEYADRHYTTFFAPEYRVYQFAVMLQRKWDSRGVGYIAKGVASYSENVQQWTLSAMCEQPSADFIPYIDALHSSEDPDIRRWLAGLTVAVAGRLNTKPAPTAADTASAAFVPGGFELLEIIEKWRPEEKDAETLRALDRAAGMLSAFKRPAA
jgi:hypothetical protein